MPWDIIVFVSITTVGFGFAVKRMSSADNHASVSLEQAFNQNSYSSIEQRNAIVKPNAQAVGEVFDLGCVDDKESLRKRLRSLSTSIRMKGQFCGSANRHIDSTHGIGVTNISTDISGMVYLQSGGDKFITEPVTLRSGTNSIKVHWKSAKTKEEHNFVTEVYSR